MRIILLGVVLSGVLCLTPDQCDTSIGDEAEYICQIDNSTVTFTSKQNDYVKILCEGPDITCENIPYFDFAASLPLKSLGVAKCPPSLLPCVNEHIDASSLEIVTLTNLSGPLTEEHLASLGDVRVLMMIQAEAQRSFPNTVVTIPTLRRLSIGGGDFQLSPNMFEHAAPLTYLELSNDRIKSIPPDTFKGLRSLNEFNLWAHPITNISEGAFRGLDALRKLSLSQLGKLTSIEPGVFSDTPLLESLYLTANKLETIPNGLLQGLNHLENITIQMNANDLTLDSEAFSNLPSLKNLIIYFCTIRHLPANLFNGSNSILKIQMTNTKIESLSSDVFLRLSSLKWLDLSFNKITDLPNGIFRGLRSLEYLNLNRNFIAVLPDGLFNGLINLKEAHMDFNNISEIQLTALQGARNLHTLSLSTNHLTLDSPNPTYLFVDDDFGGFPSAFNGLLNLVQLNLSHNKIREILYDWQAILLRLELLNLSYNEFKVIEFDNRATNFLSSKLTVDLRHNRIQTVILDKPTTPLYNNTSTATFLLDDNPLNCDCSMYGLRIRLNDTQFARNEPKFVLENARCSSPPELRGEYFTQLSPDSLTCELPLLPDSCTSCIAKVALNELVLNCRILPKLPDTNSPNISYYFVREPTITVNLEKQPQDLGSQNVHTLNLSYTGIEHIDFRPTESLKVLDVSHNHLTSVPMEFLAANVSLYLADNPIECECWYADDLAELQRYAFIQDFAQMTCANGDKIALIDTTALCNTWKASVAAIGTFVTLAVIVLIAAMICRRYSNEILVYMTTRGICKCCIKEVLLDKDKEYDVFISFAHEDLSLVQDRLLPMLENDLHQKTCVHYRDWIVGDMIPTQILRSVETSRKTIIILSKNFLESDWANLEFSAAHNLALQEGKARVILILLEESVAKHASLSEELKAYIATNTYLLWDDVKFVEKLRKVLPKKKHTFTWLDAMKHKSLDGDKVGIVGLDVQLNSDGKLVNVAKKIVDETLPHQFV